MDHLIWQFGFAHACNAQFRASALGRDALVLEPRRDALIRSEGGAEIATYERVARFGVCCGGVGLASRESGNLMSLRT